MVPNSIVIYIPSFASSSCCFNSLNNFSINYRDKNEVEIYNFKRELENSEASAGDIYAT